MKDELNVGGFTELADGEAEMVDGGAIIKGVFSVINTCIRSITDVIVKSISALIPWS